MARRKKYKSVNSIAFLLLLSGLAALIWTRPITKLLIHLRRPGTTKAMAATLSYHYDDDVFKAGIVLAFVSISWLLIFGLGK